MSYSWCQPTDGWGQGLGSFGANVGSLVDGAMSKIPGSRALEVLELVSGAGCRVQGVPKLIPACWWVGWVLPRRLQGCSGPGAAVGPLMDRAWSRGLWLQVFQG